MNTENYHWHNAQTMNNNTSSKSCKHFTPKDQTAHKEVFQYQLTAGTTMCSTAVDRCYLWAVSSSKWSQVNYYSAETGLGTSGQAPPTYDRVMGYWACLCLAPGPTNAEIGNSSSNNSALEIFTCGTAESSRRNNLENQISNRAVKNLMHDI